MNFSYLKQGYEQGHGHGVNVKKKSQTHRQASTPFSYTLDYNSIQFSKLTFWN